MAESRVLTVDDIEEFAKSLRHLSDEELVKLKTLLCPTTASKNLGLEGILQYWIENEANPTRDKLQEQTKELQIMLPGMYM